MEEEVIINCLIRKEWFESAQRLSVAERCQFYETMFRYTYYDQIPTEQDGIPTTILILFDMVKERLKLDKEKAHKTIERNRQNGQKGGRPNKLQKLTDDNITSKPSGFFGLAMYNYNSNSNSNSNVCVNIDEKYTQTQNFLVLFNFFQRGAVAPIEEMNKFYNYYEARNWTSTNGTKITDPIKCAKLWKIDNYDNKLINDRTNYCYILNYIQCEDQELIRNYKKLIHNTEQKKVILEYDNQKAIELLENKYIEKLQQFFSEYLQGYSLNYQLHEKTLNLPFSET